MRVDVKSSLAAWLSDVIAGSPILWVRQAKTFPTPLECV